MPILSGKKVAMIIASNGYRDEELEKPREALLSSGAKVVLASSSLKEAKGKLGGSAKPDILITDLKVEDFDCIVFVGGAGSSEYWDNETALEIARKAYNEGKLVAAICIAPVTLANAGILKDKRATAYSSVVGKLKNKGAVCTKEGVVTDGNIITADGPQSAEKFAAALVEKLSAK
ncbi:MAG: DJ-1/PfpI family protein [Candidatus Omnitrophica bacterium]|nr:DJ-1/PfpI family protein [Candidatus Omnitrophota bacterium]